MINGFDWFDRSIYQKRYDLEYWRQMIEIRLSCLRLLQSPKAGSANWVSRAIHQHKEVLEVTAFDERSTKTNDATALRLSLKRKMSQLPSLPPAFVLRLCDLRDYSAWSQRSKGPLQALELQKAHSQNMRAVMQQRGSKLKIVKKPHQINSVEEIREMLRQVNQAITNFPEYEYLWGLAGYAPLMVNLDKPDEEILEAIRSVRAIIKRPSLAPHEAKTKFHSDLEQEIGKWIKFGVLPYFDLKFYSKISGKRITNPEIAKKIWYSKKHSHQEVLEMEERLKKTTATYYRKVFTQATLNRLQ
jgi:hypothetical protein